MGTLFAGRFRTAGRFWPALFALGCWGWLAGALDAASGLRESRLGFMARVPAARRCADADGNRLFDNLEARMAGLDAPLAVIVRYRPGHESAAAGIAGQTVRGLPMDRSVAARLTAPQIRRLAASADVESVESNEVYHATRATSQASFGVTRARVQFGLTGDGDGDPNRYSARDHTIAILDTGIDASHPDFGGGKIIGWQDFINQRTQPYENDADGHGTHVSSIAAGAVVNGVGGVAPGSPLVLLKVLDSSGSGPVDAIVAAVDWCIQNRTRYGIDVLNLSLGTPGSSDGKDVLSRAFDRAAAAGLIVCTAAGNDGPTRFTIGGGAASASAITVGYMIDTGKVGPDGERGFALWPDSGRGPTADGRIKPDLCAPGVGILAARAHSGGGYQRLSGTSMSAPFVAGVAALMRQANPGLTPSQVKAMLLQTAVPFGGGANPDYGTGRLDAYAALARAVGGSGDAPLEPDHAFFAGSLSGTRAVQRYPLTINNTAFPIAATLLLPNRAADLDLYLLDPTGAVVASSTSSSRQETLGFSPTRAGTWTLEVYSASGSGTYGLDVSAGMSPLPGPASNRITVFRPSTREWFIQGDEGRANVIAFGGPGDVPVSADYLDLGHSQAAVYRPSTSEWFIRDDAGPTIQLQLGAPGDQPVPADYLGWGLPQIAVYRPTTQQWLILGDRRRTSVVAFGGPGDVPVPRDYFGLGRAQIAVYRPSTAQWFLRTDTGGTVPIAWGAPGDVPVPGDYGGLGRAQIAVYRPSTGQWLLRDDNNGATVIPLGAAGDQPVPFDYRGAGRTQIAVFRPTTNEWFLQDSPGATRRVAWGGPGDLPQPGVFGLPSGQ